MLMEGGKTIFCGSRRVLLLGKWKGGGATMFNVGREYCMRGYVRELLFGKENGKELLVRE